jgi:hypothetical protein
MDLALFTTLLHTIVHILLLIIGNFMMWVIYHLKHPFFEQYKVHDQPWPWEEDREKWMELSKKTLRVTFINVFLILPIFCIVSFSNKEDLRKVYSYDTDDIPDAPRFFGTMVFMALCEDITFHFAHKFLH